MVSILSLSRDAFCEQVLGFCHRDDVKQVMMVPRLCKHFGLPQGFCEIHGTKLDASTEQQQSRCLDCRMQEREYFRCEKCDGFHHRLALLSANCGKSLCGNCAGGEALYCNICDKLHHVKCSDCGEIGVCDSCLITCCGSCREIIVCDNCGFRWCRDDDCSRQNICQCQTCDKTFCLARSCGPDELMYCEACMQGHCVTCKSFFDCNGCGLVMCHPCEIDARRECSMCSLILCDNCCAVKACRIETCQSCDTAFCGSCRVVGWCIYCERFSCASCRSLTLCGDCGYATCGACPESGEHEYSTCVKCGHRCCENCFSVTTCCNCGKGYCYDKCVGDELDFCCETCEATFCKECSSNPLPDCQLCGQCMCYSGTCSKCSVSYCTRCCMHRTNENGRVCDNCTSTEDVTDAVDAIAL